MIQTCFIRPELRGVGDIINTLPIQRDLRLTRCQLRMTPAIAAGVSTKLWEIGDIVALFEAEEAKIDRKRGSYKKNVAG